MSPHSVIASLLEFSLREFNILIKSMLYSITCPQVDMTESSFLLFTPLVSSGFVLPTNKLSCMVTE